MQLQRREYHSSHSIDFIKFSQQSLAKDQHYQQPEAAVCIVYA